jgi:hypothetical protein
VLDVVAAEGPVHYLDVCDRVGEAYGVARSARRILKVLAPLWFEGRWRGRLRRRAAFLSVQDDGAQDGRPAPPACRRPAPGEEPRPPERIALEEIAAGIEWILRRDIGMPPDALVREAAQLLGFVRAGPNLERRVLQVLARLRREGRLRESGGQLLLI